jgi:hypothetical protein
LSGGGNSFGRSSRKKTTVLVTSNPLTALPARATRFQVVPLANEVAQRFSLRSTHEL